MAAAERFAVNAEGENLWRLTAQYGFIERPDIPGLLRETAEMVYWPGRFEFWAWKISANGAALIFYESYPSHELPSSSCGSLPWELLRRHDHSRKRTQARV